MKIAGARGECAIIEAVNERIGLGGLPVSTINGLPFQTIKDGRSPISDQIAVVEKNIHISADRASTLSRLAQVKALSEDQLIEKALDILFSLADLLDSQVERQGYSCLSEAALQRVWDNAEDAVYDNWRELYALPTR